MEVKHFDRWIQHFNTTIDEFFSGPKAEEAKTRAGQIAKTFQFKLGILK
jgi:hemoglobin